MSREKGLFYQDNKQKYILLKIFSFTSIFFFTFSLYVLIMPLYLSWKRSSFQDFQFIYIILGSFGSYFLFFGIRALFEKCIKARDLRLYSIGLIGFISVYIALIYLRVPMTFLLIGGYLTFIPYIFHSLFPSVFPL